MHVRGFAGSLRQVAGVVRCKPFAGSVRGTTVGGPAQREKPMAVGNPLRQFREASQKDKPMAVGGIGMITTANYVARRHVQPALYRKRCIAACPRRHPHSLG